MLTTTLTIPAFACMTAITAFNLQAPKVLSNGDQKPRQSQLQIETGKQSKKKKDRSHKKNKCSKVEREHWMSKLNVDQRKKRAARKAKRDLMSPEKCRKDDADKKEKRAKMTKEQRQNYKKDRLKTYGPSCMPDANKCSEQERADWMSTLTKEQKKNRSRRNEEKMARKKRKKKRAYMTEDEKNMELETYGPRCMPKEEEVTFQVDPEEITTTDVIDPIGKAETQSGGPGDNASENSSGDQTNTDKNSVKDNEKAENPSGKQPVSLDDKQATKNNRVDVQAVTSQLASSRASSIDSLLISTATLFLCAMVTFA